MPFTKHIYNRLPNFMSGSAYGTRQDFIHDGTRVGDKVQGWRQLIKDGRNATSNMTLNVTKVLEEKPMSWGHKIGYRYGSQPHQYITFDYDLQGFYHDLTQYGAFAHAAETSAADEAQALSRLYQRIRDESYGTNGLLFLGELRETLHMLRNPLESARRATTKYLNTLKSKRREVNQVVTRRRSDTDATHTSRRLNAVKNGMSGSWLEFSFGLKPAISDAKEICDESIRIALDLNRNRRVLTGTSKEVLGSYVLANLSNTAAGHNGDVGRRTLKRVVKGTASVRYRCGMQSQVSAPTSTLGYMSDRLGFQIQNVIPTAYELLPWSFLIDYFVNLGDIIEAATTDTRNVTWVQKTIRQVSDTVIHDSFASVPGENAPGYYWTISFTGDKFSERKIRHTSVTRTKLDSIPLPPLVFSIPGIDSTKWLNMGALLAQARDFRFR